MLRTAKCCCQDCAIAVEGEPALNAICHCQSCRRRTGTAFGWSVYFPDDRVIAITGTLMAYTKDGEAGYKRHFCARCGTTLYWKSFGFMADHTGIAGGCFADDSVAAPNMSAQHSSHYDWLSLPADWLHAG
ncbi:MAG: hypothetical protein GC166_02675 [Alphaproteobacteria bacterium]|nr:hypothetical protein [Alphaproteobacteria bacterium]